MLNKLYKLIINYKDKKIEEYYLIQNIDYDEDYLIFINEDLKKIKIKLKFIKNVIVYKYFTDKPEKYSLNYFKKLIKPTCRCGRHRLNDLIF